MKIISEINSLMDFEPWSYAVSRYETLIDHQIWQLDAILEDCYPEGMTDTQVNDLFWHEPDWLAELLGFSNWEHLERANNGEDEDGYYDEEEYYDKDYDEVED